MSERAHLSIGEVLSLLQDEFPDITISKIRFLESQGLLDPERTPSGYRKFYENDIDRLRWILVQQRENFLPLKVIKDRLASGELDDPSPDGDVAVGASATIDGVEGQVVVEEIEEVIEVVVVEADDALTLPLGDPVAATAPPPAPAATPAEPKVAEPKVAEPKATAPSKRRRTRSSTPDSSTPAPSTPASTPASTDAIPAAEADAGPEPAPTPAAARSDSRTTAASATSLDTGESAVSLSHDDLVSASGLTARQIGELERYGLLASRTLGNTTYYDEDALIIAQLARAFMAHGVEPRHIRSYKVAAEREAGVFEQLVVPSLKQRNPAARQEALELLNELSGLGEQLRGAMLRQALREYLGPS